MCWTDNPQFSDAIVDYYFAKKLAYHYLRRLRQPITVIIRGRASTSTCRVVVSNDSLSAAKCATASRT